MFPAIMMPLSKYVQNLSLATQNGWAYCVDNLPVYGIDKINTIYQSISGISAACALKGLRTGQLRAMTPKTFMKSPVLIVHAGPF